ncbi:EF-hand calcium-binding domain-containing protein 4A isoform X2 [Pseudoliparis swirei]|uniref:EF-hand calcium-binding domain-containing protein 4A isoform X2 n=1 Tax=Pseudoliparis swirei TaxID=2059687 RepID=UPI0024BED419|nr:EF-hand calcium-binding domain-containing protein 4A isoform X2 [Pseudoliparis swirei]
MSKWLNDDEVLVGQGSGEAAPVSPRLRGPSAGSPRLRGLSAGSPSPSQGVCSPRASPRAREAGSGSPKAETMGKAKELFVLCDKQGKGFITKWDMQRLQVELSLSPEQLDTVFDSLDRDSNGFLTPVEFNTGLGELMGLEDSTELGQSEAEHTDQVDSSQDPVAVRFVNILMELGADTLFKDQQELSSLWCELQRDRPELLSALDGVLIHAVSHLQDSFRERDSLEQALRRREIEHDEVVRSIYGEMENQIREEREKRLVQDSIGQKQRGRQLEELKLREQELENSLSRQREVHVHIGPPLLLKSLSLMNETRLCPKLETRVRQLSCEQSNIQEQNQQLRSLNLQLQEQVERSREQLQAALAELGLLQGQEQVARQRNVIQVSRNMQKEKDSLFRQLELLRDMNKRLRDEKDVQQSQKMNPNVSTPLLKKGSTLGHYVLQDKLLKRQLSSSELEQDKDTGVPNLSKRRQPSSRVVCEDVEQVQTQRTLVSPQRVFKVVFLGNSGAGKSSFIQQYCTGLFYSKMDATVAIDFKMKTLTLGSTVITLQLWDTAGQERFRSVTEQYYRQADGILAMYDITHASSFTAVRAWLDSVKEKVGDRAVLMLLANKLDLAGDRRREVKTREGQRLADQHQASFYECSAKTGRNVEELMTFLAGMLVSRHDRQCEDALLLTEDLAPGGCCP